MSNALTVLADSRAALVAAPEVTAEQLDLIRKTIAKDATADELRLYLYDCARQGVHPLDKLIHFTKRSGKYTPITSIDFMRIRAADTGEYAGSDDALFEGESQKPDFKASVTVWRMVQGQRCPFTASARWTEYKPESNDFMWRKMPHGQLAKCAEALALRKGFPRQLSGLYAREEMDQAAGREPVIVEAPRRVDLPAGTVQILKVEAKSARGAEWAEVTFVTETGEQQTLPTAADGTGKGTAFYEQLVQEAIPVVITTKVTPRSKKTVIDECKRWTSLIVENTLADAHLDSANTPLAVTAEDIPF